MTTTEAVSIPRIFDAHVHLRGPTDLLPHVVEFTSAMCDRAIVMPNTTPPIVTAEDAIRYRAAIRRLVTENFRPLVTIKLTAQTSPETIGAAYDVGVVAAKLYPEGVTTNAEGGIRSAEKLNPILAKMERIGMVLCVHAESADPAVYGPMREERFIPELQKMIDAFPRLHIVVEHVSSAAMVAFVRDAPDTVAATVTLHHLLMTQDDVTGIPTMFEGRVGLRPHHYCLPLPKSPIDRQMIRDVVCMRNPKFFFGSDSAPHLVKAKESCCGSPGIFTAPVLLPLLTQVFEHWGSSSLAQSLTDFTSRFACDFYGCQMSDEMLTLVKKPWQVPLVYPTESGEMNPDPGSHLVPFWAGRTINWQIKQ